MDFLQSNINVKAPFQEEEEIQNFIQENLKSTITDSSTYLYTPFSLCDGTDVPPIENTIQETEACAICKTNLMENNIIETMHKKLEIIKLARKMFTDNEQKCKKYNICENHRPVNIPQPSCSGMYERRAEIPVPPGFHKIRPQFVHLSPYNCPLPGNYVFDNPIPEGIMYKSHVPIPKAATVGQKLLTPNDFLMGSTSEKCVPTIDSIVKEINSQRFGVGRKIIGKKY